MDVTGIVLAAGAGTRAGGPKALRSDAAGTWLDRSVTALRDGGCDRVVVVLGASASLALLLVPDAVETVIADDWAEGLAASLRAGLAAASGDLAVVTLVDLPDLPAAAVTRLLAGSPGRATLRRATYAGAPGHPVLMGADHWKRVAASAAGDTGAGPYLRAHSAELIECGDLWHGRDEDLPPQS